MNSRSIWLLSKDRSYSIQQYINNDSRFFVSFASSLNFLSSHENMAITKTSSSNPFIASTAFHRTYNTVLHNSMNSCKRLLSHKTNKTKDDDLSCNEQKNDTKVKQQSSIYLHISPCGDFWIGSRIFAAKHLQPDYVKSIPVPGTFDPDDFFDSMANQMYEKRNKKYDKETKDVMIDEFRLKVIHETYDNGCLPLVVFKGNYK